jgi:ABC-type multidrug transport system fused ATPase/permease subunit
MVYVTVLLDWQLALMAMTVTPLLTVVGYFSRRLVRTRSREVKQLESAAMSVVQEVLTALRVVKAFGQEEREGDRFVQRSREGMQARIRLALFQGGLGMIRRLAMSVGVAIVLAVGVRHVQSGELSLGNLILIMGYLVQLSRSAPEHHGEDCGLQGALTSAERVLALLDQAPDVPEHSHARPLVRARGAVAFGTSVIRRRSSGFNDLIRGGAGLPAASSAPREPARRRWSTCSRVSTTPRAATFCSMAWISASTGWPTCATSSPSSCRSRFSSRTALPKTSRMPVRTRPRPRWWPQQKPPTSTIS